MDRIGVVGVGIMGTAYARNLIASGFDVTGWDPLEERRDALRTMGATSPDSVAAVAESSDVVLTALPTAAALRDAIAGDHGLVAGAHDGLIVIEMGTFDLASKDAARMAVEAVGATMLDAPVSGTGLQAEAAEIVVYASGDHEAFERVRPVFDVIAARSFDLGPFGNGSRMKYVANLLVSIHNLATAEAFTLGIRSGLDPKAILDVISAGVGSSRIFEIRGPMIVEDSYEPAAKLRMFIKDIGVIGGYARELGVPTPLLDASLPWYQRALEEGLGELDAAALARLLEDLGDVER
jgi:putative dehydrogenase